MSVLTGPEIAYRVWRTREYKSRGFTADRAPALPWIDVEPWRPDMCGPNSLDVHLGDTLIRYPLADTARGAFLDPLKPPAEMVTVKTHDEGGWVLWPGTLYLGATAERVECHGVVPWIDGRSSVGRLGVSVHVTAGRGDDGWPGPGREPAPFTLEITVVHPTILRPGMRLAQLTFMTVTGDRAPYRGRYGEATAAPVASRFHLDGGR